MSRELLQQALGALGTSTWDHTRAVGKQELITALRAALAQPEPEPVAWCELTPNGSIIYFDGKPMIMVGPVGNECHTVPLFTSPPAAPIDGFGGNLDKAFERAGMVMVPREPTEAMCISGDKARHSVVTQARTSAIYRAMIAAAPAPAVPLTDRTAQIVRPLPETMSRDEMLQHYSAHANLCAHEALQYQKRIRDLEKALSAAPADWGTPHDVGGAPWQDEPAPAVPAVCDGGTCGLGGYCTNCPRLSAAPAVPLTDERITALVTQMFPRWREDIQEKFVLMVARAVLSAAPAVREPQEHIGWCRYVTAHEKATRLVLCDSDAPGAFRVYRGIGGGGK